MIVQSRLTCTKEHSHSLTRSSKEYSKALYPGGRSSGCADSSVPAIVKTLYFLSRLRPLSHDSLINTQAIPLRHNAPSLYENSINPNKSPKIL